MTTRRNVELKAIDPSPERSLTACQALGPEDHGVIRQRDTYFHAAAGGLKLREEEPGRPHLIQWERADVAAARESRYRVIEVDDGEAARAALETALGIRGVVEKRRHLLLWRGVRIHLDDVAGLGHFVELEAVAPSSSDLVREHRLVAELREALAISDDRLVASGYAGMLLADEAAPRCRSGDMTQ